MAAYPSYDQGLESRKRTVDPRLIDRMEDGTMKQRLSFDSPKDEFTIVHPALSTTERDAIMTFYNANRALSISFTWQDNMVTYPNCLFLAEPDDVPLGAGRYRMTVRIGQV